MASPNLPYVFEQVIELFLSPASLIVLLVFVVLMFITITKRSERSSSVEESVRLFYHYIMRENWTMLWANLSPNLRAELLNAQRPVINERGEAGIHQLALMVQKHPNIFTKLSPRLVSKHKVPLKQEHLEMLMVHTRCRPRGRVITLWFMRSLHTHGHWFVEEVLIHPEGDELPYTLTGKRYPPKNKQTEESANVVEKIEEVDTPDANEEENLDTTETSGEKH